MHDGSKGIHGDFNILPQNWANKRMKRQRNDTSGLSNSGPTKVKDNPTSHVVGK